MPDPTPASLLGTEGTPAAASATPTLPTGDGTPAVAAGTSPEWAKDYLPEVQEAIAKKGFKTQADVAQAWMSAQKLVGVDPNNILVKPKDGDSEGLRKVMQSLGVPEAPDKYQFTVPDAAKDLVPKENLDAFSKFAHEHLLTPAQAQKLLEFDIARTTGAQAAADKAWSDSSNADFATLKTEWGDTFDANSVAARRGAEFAGFTLEQRQAIERAVGLKAAAEAFAKIGRPLMEASFKGGEGGGKFGLTVAEAKAKLNALMSDHKDFGPRFARGEADARKQVADLNALIAEGTQLAA